jgi:hypothetical protein
VISAEARTGCGCESCDGGRRSVFEHQMCGPKSLRPTAGWGLASCVAVAWSVSRDLRYASASIRIAARNARCRRLLTLVGANCSSRCLSRSSPAAASVTRVAMVVLRFTLSVYWPTGSNAVQLGTLPPILRFSVT